MKILVFTEIANQTLTMNANKYMYLSWMFFNVMVMVFGPGLSNCNPITPSQMSEVLQPQVPGHAIPEWMPYVIVVGQATFILLVAGVAGVCWFVWKNKKRTQESQRQGHEEAAPANENERGHSSTDQTNPNNPNDRHSGSSNSYVTCVSDSDQQESTDLATAIWAEDTFQCLHKNAHDKLDRMTPEKQNEFNIASNSFAVGFFDKRGGHLSIPDADVHLFIPPGAIKGTHKEEVYIYLTKNNISNDGVPLGNILYCGPPGLQFCRHVIFSLPLPISGSKSIENQWKLMRTQTAVGQTPNSSSSWEPINESKNALFFIGDDGKACTCFVDHFTGHCPLCNTSFSIGAFSTPSEDGFFKFHVRYWKNDQTRNVVSMEGQKHNKRLDSQPISLCEDKGDLHLDIAAVEEGWHQVVPSDCRSQVLSQSDISGEKSIEFTFKFDGHPRNQPFSCNIRAFQLNNPETVTVLTLSSPDIPENLERVDRDAQLLPADVFNAICMQLDPPPKGWLELAEKVGLPDNVISFLKTAAEPHEDLSCFGAAAPSPTTALISSPTANILGWWELRNKGRGVEALIDLQHIFDNLQGSDVSQLLDPAIKNMHCAQNLVAKTVNQSYGAENLEARSVNQPPTDLPAPVAPAEIATVSQEVEKTSSLDLYADDTSSTTTSSTSLSSIPESVLHYFLKFNKTTGSS